MKKLSIIFCICTLLLSNLLAGCGSKEPAPAADHKLRVVVTFNAMKEFTQAVGQDKIHITSLIPDGTEPHDFQPTTKTMHALSKADILIYNSTGMERWVEQATQAAANPKLVIVEAAKGTDRISLTEADEIRAHGQYDPHTWLSLSCAQQEVKNIAEALAAADKFLPQECRRIQSKAAGTAGCLSEKIQQAGTKGLCHRPCCLCLPVP